MDTQSNGHGPSDTDIIQAVQVRIDDRQVRITELEQELAQQRQQLRRDEKVVTLLRGDEPQPKRSPAPRGHRPTKIGPELLANITAAVRLYAQDHEEFRQVDIRTMPNTPTDKSSAVAVAFEELRQANVIRFVRKDGNNKYYRLTRAES